MKKPFDKIKLSQLYALCNTLSESNIRKVNYIKEKYSENALWFNETLSLLEDLKLVRTESGELVLSKTFFSTDNRLRDFKQKFLPVLFAANGEVYEQIKEFLLNFRLEGEEITFKATPSEKIKFSDVRNILLELEFIKTNSKGNYIVNSNYIDTFFRQFNKRKISIEIFKRTQAEKDEIGLKAEKAIIEYEIKRLTNIPFHPSEIEHTSQANVLAGYDIKSFENFLDRKSKKIERYIEVKAVPINDYHFFWSRNEIEAAKICGEKYFLYLLPLKTTNIFDFEKLRIINNPFRNVYSNLIEWHKEEECISFTLKPAKSL